MRELLNRRYEVLSNLWEQGFMAWKDRSKTVWRETDSPVYRKDAAAFCHCLGGGVRKCIREAGLSRILKGIRLDILLGHDWGCKLKRGGKLAHHRAVRGCSMCHTR